MDVRPVPIWVQRKIERELRVNLKRQLVEDYGIDPKKQVLIIAVPMANGWIEVRAFGATYAHRGELTRRGFRWDGKRGMWAGWSGEVNLADLDPTIFVAKEPVPPEKSALWKR